MKNKQPRPAMPKIARGHHRPSGAGAHGGSLKAQLRRQRRQVRIQLRKGGEE